MMDDPRPDDAVRFLLRWSGRLRGYLLLGGFALLAAVALGRPEGIALATPFLLSAGLAALLTRRPEISLARTLSVGRTVEGRTITFRATLVGTGTPVRLQVHLELPDELADVEPRAADVMRLRPGEAAIFARRLRCRRWGSLTMGELVLRTAGPFGLIRFEARVTASLPLRIYPRPEPVRAVPRPRHTQAFAGNTRAVRTGDGIEFADIRGFTPGDTLRRINWRIRAKARTLAVNVQHLERNVDVILFLDAFGELGAAPPTTLDRTLTAATGVATAILARRDRVGVISYGGTLRWLAPGMGTRQRWRVADTLIDTRIEPSYAWKSIRNIPPRILPPDALVIAISPLQDQRVIDALLQVRGRRHDVAVLEVTPSLDQVHSDTRHGRLAQRVWLMQREATRHRLRTAGVAVASWQAGASLQAAIEEVRAFRRMMRLPA